jgi:poly-gamma-glutamate synthesis protein (capsule biosynthesis protein)
MRTKTTHLLALMIIALSTGIFAACAFDTPPATSSIMTPQPGGPASPTPFLPSTLTPTPQVITLWISPLLPEGMQAPIRAVDEINGRSIEIVDSPSAALIRVEPDPEVPLASWVYALVAPFPTVLDNMTFDLLRAQWSEGTTSSILVSAADSIVLSALLGMPNEAALKVVDGPEIVDLAWEMGDALAIVPFDELEPRWKVLRVDGESPLSIDFNIDSYPLVVTFGLSGDPAWVSALEPLIELPASNRDADKMTVVVMTGVTALARGTAWQMDNAGETFPARDIGDWLINADFTHISHEVSFTDNCPAPDPYDPSLRFCSATRHIELLEYVDIDLVELTGNHNLDYGVQAYMNTLEMYRERGWEYFGGGENLQDALRPVLIEHNGNRLAFLGCNFPGPPYAHATSTKPGAMPCNTGQSLLEVSRLRDEGYLPIFTYQWTESYLGHPLPTQIAGFHRPIDAGAVIVSGSQAHQPMGFEFYKDGFIHYGPGNLFFDQMWSLPTRQEFVDRHIFYDGRHISTELLTALLENWSKPRPMTDAERAAFLTLMFRESGWY